jgi:hypothetical protein
MVFHGPTSKLIVLTAHSEGRPYQSRTIAWKRRCQPTVFSSEMMIDRLYSRNQQHQ